MWNLDIAKCYEKVYNNLDRVKELTKAERWGAIIYAHITEIDLINKVIGDDLLTMEEKERITARIVDLGDPRRIVTEEMAVFNEELRIKGEIDFAMEKGIEQGLEQGNQEKEREIIISMLKEKASYEFISKITGKTLEEIKDIEEETLN